MRRRERAAHSAAIGAAQQHERAAHRRANRKTKPRGPEVVPHGGCVLVTIRAPAAGRMVVCDDVVGIRELPVRGREVQRQPVLFAPMP
jgi:hypothetical protein